MEPTTIGLEIAKLVLSTLTPVVLAVFAYCANKNLQKLHMDRDKELNESQRQREEENHRIEQNEQKALDELKRKYEPHIEFEIDCVFLGPHNGHYAAEFNLLADNKGITKHEFKNIKLRVRGIKHDVPLSYWIERYKQRLEFPVEIVKDEVIPGNWNYIFVEPGIKQRISYQTIIDAKVKYITARAEFYYQEYRPHSIEKMFEVKAGSPM